MSGRLVEGNTFVSIPGSVVFLLRRHTEDRSVWLGVFPDDFEGSVDAAHLDIVSSGDSVGMRIRTSKKFPVGNVN